MFHVPANFTDNDVKVNDVDKRIHVHSPESLRYLKRAMNSYHVCWECVHLFFTASIWLVHCMSLLDGSDRVGATVPDAEMSTDTFNVTNWKVTVNFNRNSPSHLAYL